MSGSWIIETGDCIDRLRRLPAGSAQCVVTSPPYYGLRSYLPDGHVEKHREIGLEPSPEDFVDRMVNVFRAVREVLADDGVAWVNMGDSYSGSGVNDGTKSPGLSKAALRSGPQKRPGDTKRWSCPLKPKDLMGMPWRLALALQADGWWLRSDVIWHKPNPMPESVTDRPTKAHEYLFLLSKSERYFYDADAIREPQLTSGERHEGRSGYRDDHPSKGGISERKLHPLGGNKRSVWTVPTHAFPGAHFATFPPDLIVPCILAGSRPGDLVIDPFAGAGTTGMVALRHGRRFHGIELNPEYAEMARQRIIGDMPLFNAVAEAAAPVDADRQLNWVEA